MIEISNEDFLLSCSLLPIPCHTGETPHSFVVGARYNHSHYLDSRSFARIGLYLPRRDPLRPFLKVYRGENAYDDVTSNSGESLLSFVSP